MKSTSRELMLTATALAAMAAFVPARAQTQAAAPAQAASQPQETTTLDKVVVTAKRERRVSKGATNLPLEIKDTPQSISTIDIQELTDFGITGSVDALRYGTGINVEQWETNRAGLNSRGFDVMLTQVDGLGMTNDWGSVTSQQDAYLFERIEIVRGANGLLTGVGSAAGTANYVRKRPKNTDGGEAIGSFGSHDAKRLAIDYNKVLTSDGTWAGRLVVAGEDKDSHIRALHNRSSTVYGVVDGQIGRNGTLTFGAGYSDSKQRSPMWGSLPTRYTNGAYTDFDSSASTSQDWTYWNTRTYDAFVEYTQALNSDWDAKLTYNHRHGAEDTKLFYAYTLGGLNTDNTGLLGWPYRSDGESRNNIFDANLTGRFNAFGRKHEVVLGLSHSRQTSFTLSYDGATFPTMPAFPYPGNVYPEPTWTTTSVAADGKQQLTRLYGSTRISLTDNLKGIFGINAISLLRDGTSIYGGGVNLDDDKTEKVSPYVGLTYDVTPNAMVYASYSDIFQAQDQRDFNGKFLAPMKGVNAEVGVKAEWLDRSLLTTFAIFGAEQKGLATVAGFDPVAQQNWYEPKDVTSRGFEIEATGKIGKRAKLTTSFTLLKLTGPDGNDIYEWVPRRTFKLIGSSSLPALPQLRRGRGARGQSDVSKDGGARQDSYLLADGFAAFEVSNTTTLRLVANNLTDKKYLNTVQYGAIYGAPRNFMLSLEYKL